MKPGVDLVVQVSRTGFEYFLVVKTPQAAGLATVAMPWQTGSLAPVVLPGGGGAQLRAAAQSDASLVVSEAEMWDARVSLSGEPMHRADVAESDDRTQTRRTLVGNAERPRGRSWTYGR